MVLLIIWDNIWIACESTSRWMSQAGCRTSCTAGMRNAHSHFLSLSFNTEPVPGCFHNRFKLIMWQFIKLMAINDLKLHYELEFPQRYQREYALMSVMKLIFCANVWLKTVGAVISLCLHGHINLTGCLGQKLAVGPLFVSLFTVYAVILLCSGSSVE